jgi:hypothetical protein
MRIAGVLAAAFESGDFEQLVELSAADALLDWSMPGRRARVVGAEAIVEQLVLGGRARACSRAGTCRRSRLV